jgi:hypothetical protein
MGCIQTLNPWWAGQFCGRWLAVVFSYQGRKVIHFVAVAHAAAESCVLLIRRVWTEDRVFIWSSGLIAAGYLRCAELRSRRFYIGITHLWYWRVRGSETGSFFEAANGLRNLPCSWFMCFYFPGVVVWRTCWSNSVLWMMHLENVYAPS